jgi:hypothetical protein
MKNSTSEDIDKVVECLKRLRAVLHDYPGIDLSYSEMYEELVLRYNDISITLSGFATWWRDDLKVQQFLSEYDL